MSIESDRKRLAQKKTLKWIQRELDPNEWITVLKTPSEDSQGCSVYSTLIPLDKVEYHRSHLGNYCTAYGFLDHSLKEDCATIQSH